MAKSTRVDSLYALDATPSEKGLDANVSDGESVTARIERLGRARPEKFRSTWEEVGFCFSIVMSQVLTVCFISFLWALTCLVIMVKFEERYTLEVLHVVLRCWCLTFTFNLLFISSSSLYVFVCLGSSNLFNRSLKAHLNLFFLHLCHQNYTHLTIT
jgi:hypothetical protein